MTVIFSLKLLRLATFQILCKRLFLIIRTEEKKEFVKKLYLILKQETITRYLVKYDLLDTRVILRRYLEDCLRSNKINKVSDTSTIFWEILIAEPWKFLFSLLLLPVLYYPKLFALPYDITIVKMVSNNRFLTCKHWDSR